MRSIFKVGETAQAAGARVQALRGRALRPLSESELWPPVCGVIRPRPVDDPAALELASLGVSGVEAGSDSAVLAL